MEQQKWENKTLNTISNRNDNFDQVKFAIVY